MDSLVCQGLPADWLNAWLAAIGCTVLVPELRLSWSDDPIPLAVLTAPYGDVMELLACNFPSPESIASLPIARDLDGHDRIGFKLTINEFESRAALARMSEAPWSLSSLYTDVLWDRKTNGPIVDKGPFLAPMQGVDNTMDDRISKLVAVIRPGDLRASLGGVGHRVQQNGIGFDAARIGSLADDTKVHVDPIVDVLAFYGLAMFPTRGDGKVIRQRGWGGGRTGVGDFHWATWSVPLTAASVDALLDLLYRPAQTDLFTSRWKLVPFQARSTSDVTRGFASRPWRT